MSHSEMSHFLLDAVAPHYLSGLLYYYSEPTNIFVAC